MSTEAITLEVDSEAARAFKAASTEERKKFVIFVSYWLREYARGETPSLIETMDEISQKAKRPLDSNGGAARHSELKHAALIRGGDVQLRENNHEDEDVVDRQ